MAPLPVIENVFRMAIETDPFAGLSSVNVFHVQSDADSEAGDVLNTVIDALDDNRNMWNPLWHETTVKRITCTKLDGSTATVVGDLSGTIGTATEALSPASCALISIATGVRGSRGRGRVYVGPVCEDKMANGFLGSAVVALVQAAWNQFATDLDDALDTPVHFGVASYVHADFHPSVAIRCEGALATQRRRQNQVR